MCGAAACLRTCATEIVVIWRPVSTTFCGLPHWMDGLLAVVFARLLFLGVDPATKNVRFFSTVCTVLLFSVKFFSVRG